jgi:2-succinyl-6-hydroxy-2,4-cyclohexadiene-1-carboxylate synthase
VTGDSCRVSTQGVELHVVRDGAGSPVVILHGFTGSHESVAGIAHGLSDRHTTLCIDLIGHGESSAPDTIAEYGFERCVEQIADVINQLAAPPVHLVGYSMGGRAALGLCSRYPRLVKSAVLVGARAGIDGDEARLQRIHDDEALANRIEAGGVEAFVEHWMALPLFASQSRLGSERLATARRQRLRNRAHGLANSLRGMGAGAQPLLTEPLRELDIPIRLVVGSEDAKFHALAVALARELRNARVETIPAAGHAPHLENPDAFLAVTREFLAEVDSAPI